MNKTNKSKLLLIGILVSVPIFILIVSIQQLALPILVMIGLYFFVHILFAIELMTAYLLKKELIDKKIVFQYNQKFDLFLGIVGLGLDIILTAYLLSGALNGTVLLSLTGIYIVATVLISSNRLYITDEGVYTGYFELLFYDIKGYYADHKKRLLVFETINGERHYLRLFMNFNEYKEAIGTVCKYLDNIEESRT